ncbi:MAG: DNA topoisomerase IV subunit B [Alphaproteobacteria bacterium]|nr:MAG: DNA topoisomerase IV subunit B [Alphaproteobacteria bacterium]
MARAQKTSDDLFDSVSSKSEKAYSAKDIEVLEGLEPVRRRPGMYIGGTDEKALHHLFAEVLDNSMDEAVAGHASRIDVEVHADGYLSVTDNGRGIPIDPHPKFKKKSALEVIMTTLHAGGKFGGKAYETSGGLHGVGVSVVNALSEDLIVEVARGKKLYSQGFCRGVARTKLTDEGPVNNRRGTKITFLPDEEIFGGKTKWRPSRLYRMARSKAYLFGGVHIKWKCAPELIGKDDPTPTEDELHFPDGLKDFLAVSIEGRTTVTDVPFSGKSAKDKGHGACEWAITWFGGADPFFSSYCNTVPTTEGGTHESGFRSALTKGLKAYGELTGVKKAAQINADDIMSSAGAILSVFIREPEFQGQTKEKLSTVEATRIVENAVRDHFDHWLTNSPKQADKLLEWVIDRSEERLRRRKDREVARKNAVRKLRLPGKLADCSQQAADGTELFIVEGDSAGGSAKQARNRATQAILPLRGKILNVATANSAKIQANQEISDLVQALGVALRDRYREEDLRYDKVIIMTDADVDGAHIASLLITFFYREIPDLIRDGHLYLALPPLYRISQGGKTLYAKDDAHKDELLETEFKGRGKVDVGRFKGLGEMMPAQLKETTMNPATRTLLRIDLPEEPAASKDTASLVETLMGKKPELRFQYIQENAAFAEGIDI